MNAPWYYVTRETVAGVQEFFRSHRAEWMTCASMDDLQAWGTAHAELIDRNPTAWCAVETACLDLLGKETEQPIEVVLGGPPPTGPFQYSAVLGVEKFSSFEQQLRQYLAIGFADFKLKVMGDLQADRERVTPLTAAGTPGLRVRLDANNCWQRVDEACAYIQRVNGSFIALEEPLRVGDYGGVSGTLPALWLADYSGRELCTSRSVLADSRRACHVDRQCSRVEDGRDLAGLCGRGASEGAGYFDRCRCSSGGNQHPHEGGAGCGGPVSGYCDGSGGSVRYASARI